MTFVHTDWIQTQARPSTFADVDWSVLRQFIGVFALSFSAMGWYAVLHFMCHVV